MEATNATEQDEPGDQRGRDQFALQSGDIENNRGGDDQHDRGSQVAEAHGGRQHGQRRGNAARIVRAVLIVSCSQGDEIGEENDQRRLGEFRRLQRADALQPEPAVRFAVGEKDQHLQEQHHAHRAKCPGRALQPAIIAPLEIHQRDEGKHGPDQLVAGVIESWI